MLATSLHEDEMTMVSVSCCGASATGVAATVVTGMVVLPCSWDSSTEHVEVGVGVAVGVVIARTNGIKWQQNSHEKAGRDTRKSHRLWGTTRLVMTRRLLADCPGYHRPRGSLLVPSSPPARCNYLQFEFEFEFELHHASEVALAGTVDKYLRQKCKSARIAEMLTHV